MNLQDLAKPFPAGDIEWRVSRSGLDKRGKVWCKVLAYVTARAIESRLDDVCGAANWCNTPLVVHELRPGIVTMQVGISIKIGDEWITKYDVSEPGETRNIDPGKSGFSGAMKRAGAQWGVARYLYHLTETYAETSETGGKGWESATVPKKRDQDETIYYYWKPPLLPAWALPADGEKPVEDTVINRLKTDWRNKCAPTEKNRQSLATGFQTFVFSIVGDFPLDDPSKWTQQIVDDCRKRISATTDGKGPSADVNF